MFRTHREDTNETEVSVLVVKATYTVNRRCAMKQNIFLHDAMPPNAVIQRIAIAFLHIWNEDPIVRFGHIHRQWATINFVQGTVRLLVSLIFIYALFATKWTEEQS